MPGKKDRGDTVPGKSLSDAVTSSPQAGAASNWPLGGAARFAAFGRRRPRTLRLLAVITIIGVLLAGCGSNSNSPKSTASSTTAPAAPIKIRLARHTTPAFYLAFDVANQLGYFKDAGLDVSFVTANSGSAALQLLASGEADAGLNAADLVFQSWDKGNPVPIIGAVNGEMNWVAIRSPKTQAPNANKPYPENMLDLKGKTLGVTALGSSSEFFFRLMLKDAGLNPDKDATVVAVGGSATGIPALAEGRIDYLLAVPPADGVAIANGQAEPWFQLKNIPELKNYAPGLFFVTKSFATRQPEGVKRLQQALSRAVDFIKDPANIDKLVQIAQATGAGGISAAVLRSSLASEVVPATNFSYTDAQCQSQHDLFVQAKIIDGHVPCSDMIFKG